MEKNKPKKNKNFKIAAFIIIFIAVVVGVCDRKNDKKTLKNDEVVETIKDTIPAFGEKGSVIFGVNGIVPKPKTTYTVTKKWTSKYFHIFKVDISNNELTISELRALSNILKSDVKKELNKPITISYHIIGKYGNVAIADYNPKDKNPKFDIKTYPVEEIVKKPTKKDCAVILKDMKATIVTIKEKVKYLDELHRTSSQESFESQIGEINRNLKEWRKQKEEKLNWSCCSNAKMSIGGALINLTLVGNAYSRVYRNGLSDVNLYKKQLNENLREADTALRKCK